MRTSSAPWCGRERERLKIASPLAIFHSLTLAATGKPGRKGEWR